MARPSLAEKGILNPSEAIEYFVSIQSSKTGLSSFGMVNNISGAFMAASAIGFPASRPKLKKALNTPEIVAIIAYMNSLK